MFIFLATIVFVVWLTYELRKTDKMNRKAYDEYWENERIANETRKQSLDDLSFVHVPLEFIPKSLLDDNPQVVECYKLLQQLSEKPIVNFTGISNTELKLKYGSANLKLLSQYDENYTLYVRTANKLAGIYFEAGYKSNARIILEKCIESGSDIKSTYTLLAQIYKDSNETSKILELVAKADSLNSSSKNAIKQALSGFLPGDSPELTD